jgi:hypothetical protein
MSKFNKGKYHGREHPIVVLLRLKKLSKNANKKIKENINKRLEHECKKSIEIMKGTEWIKDIEIE